MTAALAALSYIGRSEVIELPFLQHVVPTGMLTAIAGVTVSVIPLLERFPDLADTLVRLPFVRFALLGCSATLAAASTIPALFAPSGWKEPITVAVFLWVLSVIAVVLLGELAWLIALGAGFT